MGNTIYSGQQNNYNWEMVKKSQLRKYTVEKIMELVNGQSNGEQLKMFGQAIADKNKLLIDKREDLISQLKDLRSRLEKVVWEMNDGVKDRIQLKAKTVMDKYCRPTKEEMKEIASLFAYIEHQCNLIQRNTDDISMQNSQLTKRIEALRPKTSLRADPTDLDEQYFQLNEQCAKEEEVRNNLIKEREANLKHYSSIAASIDQCRVEYELVEEKIRSKERELIQLTTYFEARKQQDEQFLSDLRERNMSLESELLKAQEILNNNTTKCEGLMIKEIQCLNHNSTLQ